ncbi:hypothetical protein CAOG_08372 [Capsaspora owczarzaki ATCC 30864]|uniref:Outer kinetochore protein DAD1 n=1 Tax=Capsaspora owczarzaki (strain ATCC 30864) TaxID=595528 RepID=A0A0D2W241_CAPO3|nr:hypothetical protein CAOG_08372 [Capsaspora owczarzaki ATCC 30864]KJE97206.1 hypothetical protein CAOG_010092 [Capsaspora owczarzaki ATCC 30864]KJE98432.1 hypothetical protein CAOG_008372 [Capsaspora owczarzaki ATCC 30864]|eukprot:XP_004340388.1 hypothetical protein CAOG_08372 [Capsaspora owczarzaki ATCC 30864]
MSTHFEQTKRHLIGEIAQSLSETADLTGAVASNVDALLASGQDVTALAAAWTTFQRTLALSTASLGAAARSLAHSEPMDASQ